MPILTVGPNSSFPTIAAAMLAANAGDTISLEAGYSNETATVTHNGMTVSGESTSTGIVLQLALGVPIFTLGGSAPINVFDAADGNTIVGNAGNNVITVTDGADAVDGGLGTDQLVIDYTLGTGAITGNSTTNFAEAGGSRLVTITDGTFENFTVLTGTGAETITTGAGNDFIRTGDGASTVTAGQGANTIIGGSGSDTITALDGGNFIDGGDGPNTITSGDGNDVVTTGNVGADSIVVGGGNDVVTVRGGADTSSNGAGEDRLIVDYSAFNTAVSGGFTAGTLLGGYDGQFADLTGNSIGFQATEHFTIYTGSGNDHITTGDGNDVIDTGAGDDLLGSGGGADVLSGGIGNDILSGGGGNDSLNGDTGTDVAVFTGRRSDYTINFLSPTSIQFIDTRLLSPDGTDILTNIESVQFSDQTVLVSDFGGGDTVRGGAGDDTLVGGNNNDILVGGPGADTMSGGNGADAYYVDNPGDVVNEGANNGVDTVYSSVNYALADNVENLVLQDGATIGRGNSLANVISGSLSSDIIFGFGGNDRLSGGDGNDRVSGGSGNDYIIGGLGNDRLSGDSGNDTMMGGSGNDVLYGSLGNDLLYGDGGHDFVHGGSGSDRIDGGSGNDRLYGSSGNDRIYGGSGNDRIDGGTGNDRLIGGAGQDTLTGRSGRDVFVFGEKDTSSSKKKADYIIDFSSNNGDRIDLSAIDANARKQGNQKFSFIDSSAFTKAGQVRYEKTKKDTYVYLNTDNDKSAEAVIKLKGAIDLQKDWFGL